MKKEIRFSTSPTQLNNVVMGLIKSLYKELAKNQLGKTLLIGKYDKHEVDETWIVEYIDDETEVHVKETDIAIHVIFQHQKLKK